MDHHSKELVAIAASVADRCQPCFRHQLAKALELEVAEDEIEETITLAERVGEVGSQRMSDFVAITVKGTKKEVKE